MRAFKSLSLLFLPYELRSSAFPVENLPCISDDSLIVPLLGHTAFTITMACLLELSFLDMSYDEQHTNRIN